MYQGWHNCTGKRGLLSRIIVGLYQIEIKNKDELITIW